MVAVSSEYHRTHPSLLTDNLYISAARAITSAVLLDLGITSLVNATLEMPSMAYQKQECIQIAVEDRVCSKLYVYFDLVADKIHSIHRSGGKILVYCRAGMSRSAALCIAYFIKYRDMNLNQAFQYVRDRRPIIHPNVGFMRQLREYEVKLNHSKFPQRAPQRKLLSFASEEFCDEGDNNHASDIPPAKLSKVKKAKKAKAIVSDVSSTETYVITPLEILSLPNADNEVYRPPTRAKSTTSEFKWIVSQYEQTSLINNTNLDHPLGRPPLCYCRVALPEFWHVGIVSIKTEAVDSCSEELSAFITPFSSGLKKSLVHFDSHLLPSINCPSIYELNGSIFAQRKTLSRFSKNRASVKTPGFNLSSGPKPSEIARLSIPTSSDSFPIHSCVEQNPPLVLEKVVPFKSEQREKPNVATSKLALKFATQVTDIIMFTEDCLELSSDYMDLSKRHFPFYHSVTRKFLQQDPLCRAKILPRVETCWFIVLSALKSKRSRNSLNWAAERIHHDNETSEHCYSRPDVHYFSKTPKNVNPPPKMVPLTYSVISFAENVKILPRFLVPLYSSRTLCKMCVFPLMESLNVNINAVFQLTNLFSEPRVLKVKAPEPRHFIESRNKRLLRRRIAVSVTELDVRKEFEDLIEIPSVTEASKFTKLLEGVKKESDLEKLQIWFEVFKRSVLVGRPIVPFVSLSELRPVPSVSTCPIFFEQVLSYDEYQSDEHFNPEYIIETGPSLFTLSNCKSEKVLYYYDGEALTGLKEEQIPTGLYDETCLSLYQYVDIISFDNDNAQGVCDSQVQILFGEANEDNAKNESIKNLKRSPFSVVTGLKPIADKLDLQESECEKEYCSLKVNFKKERPYVRLCPNEAKSTLSCITEPVDTFWYFQLDTPTAAVVMEEDAEKRRQKETLLSSKKSKISDSRYQLFLPDPDTVKRLEETKAAPNNELKPIPTQRLGGLVSYQRPRSRSRTLTRKNEDLDRRALRDLDASLKESNSILERRRRPDYSYSNSPRSSTYYSDQSLNSLKGLLETAQKLILQGGSSTSSSGSSTTVSRSRPTSRYYKSRRS